MMRAVGCRYVDGSALVTMKAGRNYTIHAWMPRSRRGWGLHSGAGGAPGGRAGPELESVEFPAFGEIEARGT